MSTIPADDLADLRRRLSRAAHELDAMALKSDDDERSRLRGKAQGVDLALSYLDEIVRTARA